MKRTEEHSIELVLAENNIDITLYRFTEILLSFHLETMHKIWVRVKKNKDGCIGDKPNLKLLIHLLFCFAIKVIYLRNFLIFICDCEVSQQTNLLFCLKCTRVVLFFSL